MAVKKKDESKLNSSEMRMLRWARGKTKLDHIRNEDIRKESHVKPVETVLENKRLEWFEEEEEERFISNNNNYTFTQIISIRIVYTIGKRGKQKKC